MVGADTGCEVANVGGPDVNFRMFWQLFQKEILFFKYGKIFFFYETVKLFGAHQDLVFVSVS